MPRFAISDYIFYKFACLDSSVDLRYVGSTADWKQRKRSHKSDCNNENGKKYNTKVYTLIRANGGWDNFKMIEIGKQEQLTLREAEYIEEQYRVELNANMNTHRCFRTEEQKKEQHKEYCKKWCKNNPEYNKAYKKEWCKNNPEYHKEYNKEYAQTETGKASKVMANKKYAQTETGKALKAIRDKKYAQTAEAKASKAIADKKYRAKKKLEKAETAL